MVCGMMKLEDSSENDSLVIDGKSTLNMLEVELHADSATMIAGST